MVFGRVLKISFKMRCSPRINEQQWVLFTIVRSAKNKVPQARRSYISMNLTLVYPEHRICDIFVFSEEEIGNSLMHYLDNRF